MVQLPVRIYRYVISKDDGFIRADVIYCYEEDDGYINIDDLKNDFLPDAEFFISEGANSAIYADDFEYTIYSKEILTKEELLNVITTEIETEIKDTMEELTNRKAILIDRIKSYSEE